MDKYTKELFDEVNEIKISNTEIHTKLDSLSNKMDGLGKEHKEQRKKLDLHDKIVGALVISVSIFGVLWKYGVIIKG
jgi:uncharacterized coiled-coil DUF342 family protein